MKIRHLPGIRDQLQALPPEARRKVREALHSLAAGNEADVRLLQGDFTRPLERLKVGAWRVAFYREADAIHIIQVFPRSQGYDWLATWTL